MTRSSQRCSALQRLDPLLAITRCLCTFFASGLNHLFVGPEGGTPSQEGDGGMECDCGGAAAVAAAAKREQRMDGSRADGRSDGRKEARLAAANAFTIAAVASRRVAPSFFSILDLRLPTTTSV